MKYSYFVLLVVAILCLITCAQAKKETNTPKNSIVTGSESILDKTQNQSTNANKFETLLKAMNNEGMYAIEKEVGVFSNSKSGIQFVAVQPIGSDVKTPSESIASTPSNTAITFEGKDGENAKPTFVLEMFGDMSKGILTIDASKFLELSNIDEPGFIKSLKELESNKNVRCEYNTDAKKNFLVRFRLDESIILVRYKSEEQYKLSSLPISISLTAIRNSKVTGK